MQIIKIAERFKTPFRFFKPIICKKEMKKLFTTKSLCKTGIMAALYAVLTWAFGSLAFGPVQIRPAEALTVLPLFFAEAVPALYIGCMLANLLSGFGLYDIFLGSLATLLAALATYFFGKIIKNHYLKVAVGGIFPVLFNAFLIPLVIWLASGEAAYWVNFVSLLITQSLWVYALGVPFYFALLRLKNSNKVPFLFEIGSN